MNDRSFYCPNFPVFKSGSKTDEILEGRLGNRDFGAVIEWLTSAGAESSELELALRRDQALSS